MHSYVRIGLCAAVASFGLSSAALGVTPIIEYHASDGLLPHDLGWEIEGESLTRSCPNPGLPACYWFGSVDSDPADGAPDNDGSKIPINGSGGGHRDHTTSPASGTNNNRFVLPDGLFGGYEHNYVHGSSGPSGTESYSEWIEFDNGLELSPRLEHVATVGGAPKTPTRDDLTGVASCNLLRLVGGDGNGQDISLPIVSSFNNQEGQVAIEKNTNVDGTVTAFFRMAHGLKSESEATDDFLGIRAYDPGSNQQIRFRFFLFAPRTFSGGVQICDAEPPTLDCGKFGVSNDEQDPADKPLIDGHGGLPDLGLIPPNTMFTLRIVANPASGGSVKIWVNEGTPNERFAELDNQDFINSGDDFFWGTGSGSGSGRKVEVGLLSTRDFTVWIDQIVVWQGEVTPAQGLVSADSCSCTGDNVFDTRNEDNAPVPDGQITDQDENVFRACVTGPAPNPALFDKEQPVYIGDECVCMDVDEDLEISQKDFAFFQICSGFDSTNNPVEFKECDEP